MPRSILAELLVPCRAPAFDASAMAQVTLPLTCPVGIRSNRPDFRHYRRLGIVREQNRRILQINDDWRIASGLLQWIVQKRCKRKGEELRDLFPDSIDDEPEPDRNAVSGY
jgi:hypothetical protein